MRTACHVHCHQHDQEEEGSLEARPFAEGNWEKAIARAQAHQRERERECVCVSRFCTVFRTLLLLYFVARKGRQTKLSLHFHT